MQFRRLILQSIMRNILRLCNRKSPALIGGDGMLKKSGKPDFFCANKVENNEK